MKSQTLLDDSHTVSVIIPAYNYGHLLGRAVESLFSQTHKNIEIIIIDDASTDNTKNLIKKYSDTRIKYEKNHVNIGVNKTINRGLKIATGKYLCVLSADDIFPPESISSRLKLFTQYEYDAVHTGIKIINQNDETYIKPLETNSPKNVVAFLSKGSNIFGINNATFMYSRKVFEICGYRNEDSIYFPHNDYEFALRTLLYCNVGILDEHTYTYFKHNQSHSAKHSISSTAISNYEALIKKYLHEFRKKILV